MNSLKRKRLPAMRSKYMRSIVDWYKRWSSFIISEWDQWIYWWRTYWFWSKNMISINYFAVTKSVSKDFILLPVSNIKQLTCLLPMKKDNKDIWISVPYLFYWMKYIKIHSLFMLFQCPYSCLILLAPLLPLCQSTWFLSLG